MIKTVAFMAHAKKKREMKYSTGIQAIPRQWSAAEKAALIRLCFPSLPDVKRDSHSSREKISE